ncbi:myelin protein zero-like protein 2 [Aphelocoma coerulescens]|uniref:myelin protein zero-like protein 2 n=1 Tax=Aphelocoma coerulescens TaxID=39617 RepID=UPI0036043EF5
MGRSERGWAHLGRERSPALTGRAGGKESALLCWEDFEKLIFHPVTESPKRICLCSPGLFSPMRGRTWLGAALVLGVQLRALWLAAAVEVHTAKEVVAVNGTNQRLKCTFSSSSPVSDQLLVSWNFQPEDLSSHEPVFRYLKEPYKPPSGRFKERVTWDGNIERNDVSIIIWNLQPTDNGTFTCQVTNRPDVYGTIGEVRLRVVQRVTFSEIHFLAMAIGSASGLMIIVVTAVIICRQHRRKARDKRIEVADTELKEKESLKLREEKEPIPLED